MKNFIFPISGAIPFNRIETVKDDEGEVIGYKSPEKVYDRDYKYLAFLAGQGDIPFVSKDREEWIVALSVCFCGREIDHRKLYRECMKGAENE